MKRLLSISMISICYFLSSCSEAAKTEVASEKISFSLDSVKTAIAESNGKFENSWATGDSALLAGLYGTNGCQYPPNMKSLCGAASISAYFNGGYGMGIRKVKLTTDEIVGNDEAVTEVGKYEMMDSSGNSLDKGKYIVLWKKEGAAWKMYRDIWNSDMPMLPAATAKQ